MTVSRISALALFICLIFSSCLSRAAAKQSGYSAYILQYVQQDKVYLLEKLRPSVTKQSEKTVIDALLSEDGPRAAYLFQKQLKDYPDPSLDSLSKARLAAYRSALSSEPEIMRSVTQHAFILQFGSFGSPENARKLAMQVSPRIPVRIFSEKGQYKVRSKQLYRTRAEAAAKAKKLPFNSYVVHLR